MNGYVRVILAMSGLAAVLAVAVLLLSHAEGSTLLSAVILGEAIADLIAVLYLGRVLLAVRGFRLWLLALLFTTAAMTTIGCAVIGFLVAWRFLGNPPFAGTFGLVITGMGLVVAMSAPVTKALVIYLWRRSDGNGATR